MNESHEALQHYLGQIDAGVALEEVLDQLPDEHVRLASLISIAHALRQAPAPPHDAAAAAKRDRIVYAAMGKRAAEPTDGEDESGWIWSGWRKWRLPSLHFIPQFQFSGGLVTVLVVAVAFWALFMRGYSGVDASSAQYVDGAGLVEVASAQGDAWEPLALGGSVEAGQRVRTGTASTAMLVFFDGSELHLAPESEIAITQLRGAAETLVVEISQEGGRTAHDVVPLRGADAAYVVRTPGGSATVHGTSFSVSVKPNGESQFAVNEGEVSVEAAGEQVVLYDGQVSLVNAGEPPSEPEQPPRPSLTFEPDELEAAGCQSSFSFSGVLRNDGSEEKDIAADVVLDQSILSGGEWISAVIVERSSWTTVAAGEAVPFEVQLELAPEWESAADGTEIKIRVFVGHESNWPDHHQTRLTVTAVLNCEQDGTPTPTITATVTPTATITATPTISGTVTATPEPTMTPGGTECTESDPHPEATLLAERYDVPYEEIMGWFCAGFGFGEIDIAYGLAETTESSVDDIFDMRTSGMGWGQIRQELGDLPGGPPDDVGPPDDAGPPEDAGPPDGAGPPDDPGPPDDAGPPDDPGPPDDAGPPDESGPPDDAGPPDEPGPPGGGDNPSGGGVP